MPHKNVVTWNTIIRGYFLNGYFSKAISLFREMPERDIFTYNIVISGLMHGRDVQGACEVFEGMVCRDVVTWNAMIGGYFMNGMPDKGLKLFELMPVKDVISWNLVIEGLMKCGKLDLAEEYFKRMSYRDVASWTVMISGLSKAGRTEYFEEMPVKDLRAWNAMLEDALGYFMEMPSKCCKTLNSILLGLIRNGLVKEAHAFLKKQPYNNVVSWTDVIVGMKESGFHPDESTFTSILTICSNLPSLDLVYQIHAQVAKSGLNHFTAVSNALVTMYERCGNMHSALLGFFSMPSHRDVISWNSIICGFAHHGNAKNALKIFERMRLTGVKPNHIIFVGVLSACSHAGLVEKGKYYFDYMKSKCCLEPTSENYTCIVDLLGRSGLIDEAMSFLNEMRVDAAERVLEMEPHNSGIYLILAEMYLLVDEEMMLRLFELAWRRRELGSNRGVVGLRPTAASC
ncbi:Serine-threonine protein kinase, plant-type [Hibiscus syriacus]|uniref:Serine-threonine protein kinase, plant-type n=1 Tax=Hibiscus syriacus TaxID=106335 RepID=A0A6A2WXT1_HIBSY|nr:Serine-threonine protein kinase, plant-type [Hibiscus syriacus]